MTDSSPRAWVLSMRHATAAVFGSERSAAHARARASVAEHGGGVDEAAFAKLAELLRYVDGDYAEPATFERLRKALPPHRVGRCMIGRRGCGTDAQERDEK